MSVFEEVAGLIISKLSNRWGVADEDDFVDTAKDKIEDMFFEDEPAEPKKKVKKKPVKKPEEKTEESQDVV